MPPASLHQLCIQNGRKRNFSLMTLSRSGVTTLPPTLALQPLNYWRSKWYQVITWDEYYTLSPYLIAGHCWVVNAEAKCLKIQTFENDQVCPGISRPTDGIIIESGLRVYRGDYFCFLFVHIRYRRNRRRCDFGHSRWKSDFSERSLVKEEQSMTLPYILCTTSEVCPLQWKYKIVTIAHVSVAATDNTEKNRNESLRKILLPLHTSKRD